MVLPSAQLGLLGRPLWLSSALFVVLVALVWFSAPPAPGAVAADGGAH